MTYYKKGTWAAICDVCGFEFKSDELRKNWKGLIVCRSDYEQRQPQEFIRARHEDTTVPWTRPEPPDTNILVCYIWDRSGYTGLAKAGCMIAGNNTYSATFLSTQKNEGQVT